MNKITNLSDINSSQWSIALTGPGEVVTDLEDIKQCMYIVLCTRKGTAPMWPEFGCGLFDWIDQPMAVAAPKMARDIKAAIARWETRAIIEDVTYWFEGDGSATIKIFWRPVDGTKLGSYFSVVFGAEDGKIYLVDEVGRYILTSQGYIIIN